MRDWTDDGGGPMLPADLEKLLQELGQVQRRRLAFLLQHYAEDRRIDATLGSLAEEEKLDAAVAEVRTRVGAYLRAYLPRPWKPWR
jgi:hypothetical protein